MPDSEASLPATERLWDPLPNSGVPFASPLALRSFLRLSEPPVLETYDQVS